MLLLRQGGQPRSIQFWLTWLVIACILPAAVGVGFLVLRSYEQQRSILEAARIGVARALIHVVDGELAGAASVLQVLAESSLIGAGDLADFEDKALQALATTSGSNIVLFDRDGTQIMNTLHPFGTKLPGRADTELRRHNLESGRPTISNLFFAPDAGQALVAIQVPVTVGGQTKYLLAMGFFTARLSEILHRENLPKGWIAAIYDRNGTIAARTVDAEQFVGRPAPPDAVRSVALSPQGAFESLNLEGAPIDATFSRSSYSGLAVVIGVPAAMATAELKRSLWLNAAGAVSALLLGAVLARRVSQRIARSITALGVPALALVSDAKVVLPPVGIIEVDALRIVLLKAARIIEQERDAARDAEGRMLISAEAADKANRAKSGFLASISHELRTPLHGILGYAEMLRLEGDLTPTQLKQVQAMLGAGQHLLGMINAVLDMSQIEADQMDLQPQTIELSGFIRACLDVIRPAAEEKRLALTVVVAEQLRLVADPTRLRQVLVNLLGNAIKFTWVGSVELRLRKVADGATIRIEVADTGPGVPAEHRDKLFRSFERLDGSALNAVEGAGLGLALSARLVMLMGGSLRYDDNLGGGSVFWFELPIGDVRPLHTVDVSSGSLGEGPLTEEASVARALYVLVVDDVPMNRDIATAFLRAGGHTVRCAESGEAAIAEASSTDFDVVLMDVRMPGMDGLEATRRIRALPGARGRVPIVAVTAQAFAEQVADCRKAGMGVHLGKPFDQAKLLAAVNLAADAGPVRGEDPVRAIAVAPRGSPTPDTGFELPVIERDVFEKTASSLAPAAAEAYLRTIADLGDALLRDLRGEDALTRNRDALVHAAHTMAGSAGMFGFRRVSEIGRNFERAMQSGPDEQVLLAERLNSAIEATLLEVQARIIERSDH